MVPESTGRPSRAITRITDGFVYLHNVVELRGKINYVSSRFCDDIIQDRFNRYHGLAQRILILTTSTCLVQVIGKG